MDCKVEIGTQKSNICFRVSGYGTFKEATKISRFLNILSKKEKFDLITFDLKKCEKMDSTFMGIIASMACEDEGEGIDVQIACCEGTAYSCLEDLGLTEFIPFVKEVNMDDVSFVPLDDIEIGLKDQQDVIYLSHRILSSLNESNRKKFAAVIKALNAEKQ